MRYARRNPAHCVTPEHRIQYRRAAAPSTSPFPRGNRPANRQVRRAGKRDGLELHDYLIHENGYTNRFYKSICRLDGIATDTGYAIAIDTSACRVGIFAAADSGYTLERAFNADLGYIDGKTGKTHTFTGEWHIDHRSESIPEGASFFTCFVPCWNDDGTDDGQGFHSGYDGNPGYESTGCTRLFYNDARYIYDNIPDGTPVIVY